MALQIKINDVVVLAEQGFSYNTITSLKYDSGFVNLPLSSRKKPYEPDDIVEILSDDTLIRRLVVMSDKSTSEGSSGFFRHELTIVEETIILERIFPENRVIRNQSGQPVITGLDAWDTIVKFITDYNITLDTGLDTALDAISIPDVTLNGNTFKEFVNELFNEIDGVPRIVSKSGNNIVLGIDYYTQRNDQINTDTLSSESLRSFEDYFSGYKGLVSNASVGESIITGGFWYPSPVGSVKVRAADIIFDDETAILKLPPDKLTIKMVQQLLIDVPTLTLGFLDIDITPYTIEKTIWDTLILGSTNVITLATQEAQANTLYWQINGTTIENMSEDYGILTGVGGGDISINNVVRRWMVDNGIDLSEFMGQDTEDYNYRTFYDAIFDTELYIDASNVKDITRKSLGYYNQKSSFSDLLNLSTSMFNAINRVGHVAEQGVEIITSFEDAFKLGDYELSSGLTQDKVIYGIEFTFYNRQIFQKYLLMDSHTRGNQRIEIDNAILKSAFDKPVFRKHLTEVYIEFSFTQRTETQFVLRRLGKNIITNNFAYDEDFNKPAYIGHFHNNDDTPFINSIYTPAFAYAKGNAIHIDSGFVDTINSMERLDSSSGALGNSNVPYANDDGTLESFTYSVSSDAVNTEDSNDFPIISNPSNSEILGYSKNIDKSSGEVLGLITRIPFISEIDSNRENKFIIGETFLTNNSLVKDAGIGDNLFIYTSTEKYDIFDNKKAKGEIDTMSYTFDRANGTINVTADINFYWAIADANKNLYLACNVFPVTPDDTIFINYLDHDIRLNNL